MNKKQFLRTVCFLLLAVLLFLLLCDLFDSNTGHITQRIRTYRDQKPGAIDAVYIGTSGVDRYWIAAKAYEDYGMTVYPLSSDGAPCWLMLNQIRDAQRTQTPQLYILDLRSFTWDVKSDIPRSEVRARRIIDVLPFFSSNRLDAIKRSSALLHEVDPENYPQNDLSFYLPFIRQHDKWHNADFSFVNLQDPPSQSLGFYMSFFTVTRAPQEYAAVTEERAPLEAYNEANLRELISFIKEKDLSVLFLVSPYAATSDDLMQFNTIQDILEEEGFPYLFFNTAEMRDALPIDAATEFYNDGHVNYWGAVKYTDYLAAYLNEHYDFPDHRDDPRCASWNGVYATIQKRVASLEKQSAA